MYILGCYVWGFNRGVLGYLWIVLDIIIGCIAFIMHFF
jgi:hypothetical protein